MADFSVWPCLAARLSRWVGGVPTGPRFVPSWGFRDGRGWSAWSESLQAAYCPGELGGPGPGGGEAQARAAAAAGEPPGGSEQAQPQAFGFSGSGA